MDSPTPPSERLVAGVPETDGRAEFRGKIRWLLEPVVLEGVTDGAVGGQSSSTRLARPDSIRVRCLQPLMQARRPQGQVRLSFGKQPGNGADLGQRGISSGSGARPRFESPVGRSAVGCKRSSSHVRRRAY